MAAEDDTTRSAADTSRLSTARGMRAGKTCGGCGSGRCWRNEVVTGSLAKKTPRPVQEVHQGEDPFSRQALEHGLQNPFRAGVGVQPVMNDKGSQHRHRIGE